MAHHTPAPISPKQEQQARETWDGFKNLLKYSLTSTVGLLLLLGLIFIDW
ncbi:MAG: hypothetical protein K9G62_05355 [Alphaproteobacteria bacterium]|nr:hypothetical protein [Alphaproteobacteria bacterium]